MSRKLKNFAQDFGDISQAGQMQARKSDKDRLGYPTLNLSISLTPTARPAAARVYASALSSGISPIEGSGRAAMQGVAA